MAPLRGQGRLADKGRAGISRAVISRAVVSLVVLASCAKGTPTPAAKPPATTATTISQADVDKQRAMRIVLYAADLPGYFEKPPSTSGGGFDTAFADCTANDPVLTGKPGTDPRHVAATTFSMGKQSVTSEAVVAQTVEQATAATALIVAKKTVDCVAGGFRAAFSRTGAVVRALSLKRIAVPTVADEAVGLDFVVSVRAARLTATTRSTIQFIRKDRAVAFLTTTAVGTTFPAAERDMLAQKIASRMD